MNVIFLHGLGQSPLSWNETISYLPEDTEAYREHIMYTFNVFCKTVIRYAALNAWRDRSRRRQKEISLNTSQKKSFTL